MLKEQSRQRAVRLYVPPAPLELLVWLKEVPSVFRVPSVLSLAQVLLRALLVPQDRWQMELRLRASSVRSVRLRFLQAHPRVLSVSLEQKDRPKEPQVVLSAARAPIRSTTGAQSA